MYKAGIGGLPIPNEVRGQDGKLLWSDSGNLIYSWELTTRQVTPSDKRSARDIATGSAREWLESVKSITGRNTHNKRKRKAKNNPSSGAS
jgi:hypothetical protein